MIEEDLKLTRKILGSDPFEASYCFACDDGGWECYGLPTGMNPYFRECRVCHNPQGIPSP